MVISPEDKQAPAKTNPSEGNSTEMKSIICRLRTPQPSLPPLGFGH